MTWCSFERHNKRAPRHLENSPMKTQLDGQKTLCLSLLYALPLSLLRRSSFYTFLWSHFSFVYFISLGLLALSKQYRWKGRDERDWGKQQVRHVFPPDSPSSVILSVCIFCLVCQLSPVLLTVSCYWLSYQSVSQIHFQADNHLSVSATPVV